LLKFSTVTSLKQIDANTHITGGLQANYLIYLTNTYTKHCWRSICKL